ncbi:MAG: CRISPR-associated endoribonuclease Cas6 [Candidatus Aenigmarchaeota archaeon]|nr:CRISPR-associated endoribonuclease Cas6 [Candidatus Aenigmarchaeota archaeon]
MRLLIDLNPSKNYANDPKYHNKLQGFIYKILKKSEYKPLHDKKGCKYFCFSNIFPGKEMNEGDVKHFMISSPDKLMIHVIKQGIEKMKEINIGEMQFSLEAVKEISPRISENCVIKTSTPIIIRIPQYRYTEYGINSQYSCVFWKPEHDFNAFLKQLSENVIKKYNEYNKTEIKEHPVFQQFAFDGSYPIHTIIDQREQIMIGSYWKFIFEGMTKEQQELLQFALDCGFGELNSLGFGFVNVIK